MARNNESRWLSIRAAARWLGVTRQAVYGLIKRGRLTTTSRPIPQAMISEQELAAYQTQAEASKVAKKRKRPPRRGAEHAHKAEALVRGRRRGRRRLRD